LWRERYTPYGVTLDNAGANDDQAGYTGHIKDSDTGLVYMQARYYDPVIGRFYSNDPVGYTAKNPVMSFNRYLYVNNNPFKYTDPDGNFLKLLKAAYNVGKRAYKNGGDFKKAGADELVSFADNLSTLADGQLTLEDAFAVVDLATGFGDEAKKGFKLIDSTGALSKKTDTKAMTLDTKSADNALYNSLETVGPNPQNGPLVKPQTTTQKLVEGARSFLRIFSGED
jgi:RHS repeat-associated protein